MSAVSSDLPLLTEWRSPVNPWLIAAAVMAATFMEVLDTTIVNVSLPHIAGSLSSSVEESTWVLTSYLVANAIVLPATGWLGRKVGRKRFLLICIALFTIASAVCGAATSLGVLIAARIVQGAGGGALQPMSQALLLESFPPNKRGVAMAVFGMGVVVAPIIGPTLGGWMTDNYSWRWVFYVNLPIGLAACAMVYTFIQDPPYLKLQRPGGIDYIGFGLLTSWIASLQIVLDKGQQEDWFSSNLICWLTVICVITLIAFIWWELKVDEPLVDLRVLKNSNFRTGTFMMMLMGAVLYGSIALLPLFLQTLMGYPALQSGLTVSPRGFGSIVGMVIVGRILGIIDGRWFIAIGFVIVGLSTHAFGKLNLEITGANVTWPNIFNGFGTALIFVPLTTITMGTLRNEQIGNATGIYNLMRNLGGSVGIATVTTMLARGSQAHQNAMVNHLTPYDPAYQHWMNTVSSALGKVPGRETFAIMYGELQRQASLAAFMDNFNMLALLCLLCLPGILLLKKGSNKPIAGAH